MSVSLTLRRIAYPSTGVCAPSVMGRPKGEADACQRAGGLAPVGTDSVPAAKGLAERVGPVDRAGGEQVPDGMVVAVFPSAAVSLDPVMHRLHIELLVVLVSCPEWVRGRSGRAGRPGAPGRACACQRRAARRRFVAAAT